MFLFSLSLSRFRNYTSLELSCPRGLSLLSGENAQGKSNLLEAMYLVSTGRSFRTNKIQELVQWGQERFEIRAAFEMGGVAHKLEASAGGGHARYALDGKPRRAASAFGNFKAVVFASEDLDVVRQEPSLRRRFFDLFFGQLENAYAARLDDYTRVVKSRNLLLKQERFGELGPWDELLVRDGAWIAARRKALLKEFEGIAAAHHRQVSAGKEELSLAVKSSAQGVLEEEIAAALRQKLQQHSEHERVLKTTLCGPHRDDYEIAINASSARSFGSEGQKRSVMLSLRMSQWKCLAQRSGEAPMILLDDVLGELDTERQRAFVHQVTQTGAQAFVALTDAHALPGGLDLPVFTVRAGSVAPAAALR